jgi:integrase
MKGHIRERSLGHWAIVLDVSDPETGKRKRKWHSFRGTKREAQIECARIVSNRSLGTYVEPSKLRLNQFLELWLEHMRSQVAPRTFERYGDIARKNIAPLLGNVSLMKLQPAQISGAYAKALSEGRRDGKGGLSASTVRYMHSVLREALGQAVLWGMLPRNPVDAVSAPRQERNAMKALDATQTVLLLDHFRPTRMFIPVLVAVLCGLRRGEIAGLRWKSVDLSASRLAVVESIEQTRQGTRAKETKSGRGRLVALPALVTEELRRHRVKQAEELFRLGTRADNETRVILREDGCPLQPSTLTHRFSEILARCGELPRIRFHDLRHSHATHLLSAGVHPKIAQERLGHSSIGITLDLYSHVLPGMQEDAASKVDAAIRGEIERASEREIG